MKSRFWISLVLLASTAHADVYRDQYERSIQGVLANMLDNGATVASPSRSQPDYYYDWVRDTALTMKTVVQLSHDQSLPASLRQKLMDKTRRWIGFELARQQTRTLTDLGEPKFYVDGKANLEPWGRPQNDGPALRALTAIEIANSWIQNGRFRDVLAGLYRPEIPANTLIKRDLEYVAHHWTETSFDLWEEERAMHFYTLTVQKVALLKGSQLANIMGDPEAAKFYSLQAKAIDTYLNAFIDAKTGIIQYAIQKESPLPHKQSPLDIAVLLAAIQTYDGQFYVPMKPLTETVNQLVTSFQMLYNINWVRTAPNGTPLGVALGRYPDDRYSGVDFSMANPWFLATLALAEFTCETRGRNDDALRQFNRVLYHRQSNGALSEQFDRDTGYQRGARDLTWSYTSYITAYRACFQKN